VGDAKVFMYYMRIYNGVAMKYARDYISRYYLFVYRRALGLSMATFAVALSVGMLFTLLTGPLGSVNLAAEFVFWILLMLLIVLTVAISIASTHVATVRHMTETERRAHSKYVGIWLIAVVVGVLVFSLPLVLASYSLEPLAFLIGSGGILWVLYIAGGALFRHYNHEVAFGAAVLLIVALAGVIVGGSYANATNTQAYKAVSLAASVVTLVLVFGFMGLMMLFNSTLEFSAEIEGPLLKKPAPRSRRR